MPGQACLCLGGAWRGPAPAWRSPHACPDLGQPHAPPPIPPTHHLAQVLAAPPGYEPIRTPARKLMATPTPYGGTPLYQIPEEDR